MAESPQQAFLVKVRRPARAHDTDPAIVFYAVLAGTPVDALDAVDSREGDDVELSYAGSCLRRENVEALGLRSGEPVVL